MNDFVELKRQQRDAVVAPVPQHIPIVPIPVELPLADAQALVKLIAVELGLRPTAGGGEILAELKRLRAIAVPADPDAAPAPLVAPEVPPQLLSTEECRAIHEAVALLGELMPAEMLATLSGLASRLPGAPAAESEAA